MTTAAIDSPATVPDDSLPAGWEYRPLGKIALITIGRTPSRDVPAYWGPGHPWASISDMKGRTVVSTREEITDLAASSMSVIPRGTLMMSFKLTIGRVAFSGCDLYSNEAICAIRDPNVEPDYLYYALQRADFAKVGSQAVKGYTLNSEALARLEVLVPPEDERRAIAAALAAADAEICAVDELIAKSRAVRAAVSEDLLTGRMRLPGFRAEWRPRRLGDLGRWLKGSGVRKDEAASGHLPCVRYGEIYTLHGDVLTAFHSFISPEVAATAQRITSGDLLFAGSGETAEEIGKCVAYVGDEDAYAGGDIVILRLARDDAAFMGHLMNAAPVVRQKARLGQGDAVVHISSGNLAALELMLPDLDEQKAIAQMIADLDRQTSALTKLLDKARAVKVAMAQELFSGRTRLA